MSYAAHARYIAAARHRPALWRSVLGVLLIVALYIGPLLVVTRLLELRFGAAVVRALGEGMATGSSSGGMRLLLYSFGFLAIGPMVAARLLHDRAATSLFGPVPAQAIRDFLRVAAPIVLLQLCLLPLALADSAVSANLGLGAFLGYLPVALAGILVQTGAEELVFRGYLQQNLAARFGSPLVWIGVPSLLFAAGHYAPSDFGANAGLIALWAGVFSLLAADLTARSGSLGAAMGFHFANNVMALLLVALRGSLDGLALWHIDIDATDPAVARPFLAVDFLAMFVAWLLARLSLRR